MKEWKDMEHVSPVSQLYKQNERNIYATLIHTHARHWLANKYTGPSNDDRISKFETLDIGIIVAIAVIAAVAVVLAASNT